MLIHHSPNQTFIHYSINENLTAVGHSHGLHVQEQSGCLWYQTGVTME